MDKVIKTEVQGLEAQTLIDRLDKLETGQKQIQKSINSTPNVELWTRDNVAKFLDISLPTLHDWSKKNILQRYRIGNKIRYKKHEVLEALHSIKSK